MREPYCPCSCPGTCASTLDGSRCSTFTVRKRLANSHARQFENPHNWKKIHNAKKQHNWKPRSLRRKNSTQKQKEVDMDFILLRSGYSCISIFNRHHKFVSDPKRRSFSHGRTPLISGGGGVVWLAAWLFLVFEAPRTHPRISPEERVYIEDSLAEFMNEKPQEHKEVRNASSEPGGDLQKPEGHETLLRTTQSIAKLLRHFVNLSLSHSFNSFLSEKCTEKTANAETYIDLIFHWF